MSYSTAAPIDKGGTQKVEPLTFQIYSAALEDAQGDSDESRGEGTISDRLAKPRFALCPDLWQSSFSKEIPSLQSPKLHGPKRPPTFQSQNKPTRAKRSLKLSRYFTTSSFGRYYWKIVFWNRFCKKDTQNPRSFCNSPVSFIGIKI